jgi:hypothetical protein
MSISPPDVDHSIYRHAGQAVGSFENCALRRLHGESNLAHDRMEKIDLSGLVSLISTWVPTCRLKTGERVRASKSGNVLSWLFCFLLILI